VDVDSKVAPAITGPDRGDGHRGTSTPADPGHLRLAAAIIASRTALDTFLLFAGLLSVAFVVCSFGQMAIEFPSTDATGRYAIPLASVLPIIVAGEIVRLAHRSRSLTIVSTMVLLACTAYGYLYSPPAAVWQSPYWRYLPASTTQLVAALDELDVDAVWINHWAGTPLMFDTRDRISAADYFDLAVGHEINRLPAATNRVRAAELPAYVFVTDESFVEIEEWLRSQDIPYAKRVAPNYVVIQPLHQVDPSEVVDYLGFDT
jgi:hypothetical protein